MTQLTDGPAEKLVKDARWHIKGARQVVERIVVEGDLVVQTPMHLGTGDDNEMGRVTLLMDQDDALLTGTTLAGALRSYLLWYEFGADALPKGEKPHQVAEKALHQSATVALFGGSRQDDEGDQSNLIIDDTYAKKPEIEMRDGVRIDPESRTAADGGLYSFGLWQAGTTFKLRFELLVYENSDRARLLGALATVLTALENGEISLGVRKHRGFGRVKVTGWRTHRYDLTKQSGLVDWIKNGNAELTETATSDEPIQDQLNTDLLPDKRRVFNLKADFVLDGSLLIRSDGALIATANTPNMVHLSATHMDNAGNKQIGPILSGTSIAGAIRARAYRIVNTLYGSDVAQMDTNQMFGTMIDEKNKNPDASRVFTHDAVLDVGDMHFNYVQNRVSIDRFTGGAKDGALFSQKPVFSNRDVRVTLEIQLLEPDEAEIGLLLMLLKDLWTADLPLGGESSVGRGRLWGQCAHLTLDHDTWELRATDTTRLDITGNIDALEDYAHAFYGESR
jgi:CRISPR/Cas system CSM-associated protein Csm3 (group 7 of RAMP superfamily)